MQDIPSPNKTLHTSDFEEFQETLGGIIADAPMTGIQILVISVCFILNMIDGMDILVVSFTASELEAEWNLSKSQLGYIYSTGLFGMMIGCLAIAPYADKIGRAKILLYATSLIAVGMLITATVTSYKYLLIMRLITGLGIGTILPTMAAMAAEFANERRRDFCVSIVQAGWPIGAILTGLFVAWAVPQFGWRIAYVVAGTVSLVMLPIIYFLVPESVVFLGKRQPKNALQQINQIIGKIANVRFEHLPPRPANAKDRVPVRELFADEYRPSTAFLWIGIFFSFMTLYTLISWIPNIARTSGMPFELATYAGTALNIGAFIGSMGIGLLSTWFSLKRLIFVFMIIAFGLMSIYGNIQMIYALVFVVVFLIGVTVQGGFNGFYPAAARVYPSNMRATGIGWAVGAGRTGAILGPALFGILFDAGIAISTLFVLFSIPLVLAGIAAVLIPSKRLS